MCHDWDRFYNETINGIEFVSYESRKSQKYVPVQLQIAPITKSPRAFAPCEKQKRRILRTNTASYRIYNEIVEDIRALWKVERINAASDAFAGITKLHNLLSHSPPMKSTTNSISHQCRFRSYLWRERERELWCFNCIRDNTKCNGTLSSRKWRNTT